VGLEPHKGFVKLGKKYGGIFAFDYGSYQSVVINDLKLMKQCLNDLAFAGRPRLQFFLERTGPQATYCRGIIVSEKRHWSEQRRFVLKNLRDFGFDKSTMEGVIQEEITEFIDTLRKDVGRPIKTRGLFNTGVLILKISARKLEVHKLIHVVLLYEFQRYSIPCGELFPGLEQRRMTQGSRN